MATRREANRLVLIVDQVTTAGEGFCSNNCQHMSVTAGHCDLFDAKLTWDKRKRYNGNKRLAECIAAENSRTLTEVGKG